MSDFDESKHARDTGGRFAEMAGSEQPDTLTDPLGLAAEAEAIRNLPDDLYADVVNGRKTWEEAVQAAWRIKRVGQVARAKLDAVFGNAPSERLDALDREDYAQLLDGFTAAVVAGTELAPRRINQPYPEDLQRVDAQVELRAGEREISDGAAGTIAADALLNIPETEGSADDYPMLRQMAEYPSFPWSDAGNENVVVRLHRELGRLYGSPYVTPARKARINALFTFALHGGDNN